jgi:hypothetical protein
MRIVMTLLVRDEADVIEHNLRYHFTRGVDFVVATDHRSTDGTTEILREFEREGRLRLIRETGTGLHQSEWVTRMARLAATKHGADWVVNCDADEFWWPRSGPFDEILSAVPRRYGTVRGLWRHFVLRPERDDRPFYEDLVVRRRSVPGGRDVYIAQIKVAHRADPDVVVPAGNHDAYGRRLVLLRGWYPFEVFHFSVRTRAQLERKFLATWEAARQEGGVSPHVVSVVERLRRQGLADVHHEFLVDDAALAEGLGSGVFVVDTRLRNALRVIATGAAGLPGLPVEESWAPAPELLREIDAHQANDAEARVLARVQAARQRQRALDELLVVRVARRRRAHRSAVP